MTLYELTDTYAQLYELAAGGDIDEQTFLDTLEATDFTADLEAKAEGYAKIITNLQGEIAQCKAEEERLAENRRAKETNIKRMKERLQQAMDMVGRDKIKTPLFSLNVQNNPPSVTVADERAVPEKYLIPQPPKVDKKAILADIKAGAEFDWVTVTQGRSLRIR